LTVDIACVDNADWDIKRVYWFRNEL